MSNVRSYRSPKLEVRSSAVAGKGAFAKESIAKDEIVWIRSGHIISIEEGMKLDERLLGYTVQIQDNFLLCARNEEEVADFVIHFNHSCEPNVGLFGEVTYVAMRDIKPGEELVVDYAMFVTRSFKLDCKCGCDRCRGVITGEDWKIPELRERYGEYFAYYIQRKFRSFASNF